MIPPHDEDVTASFFVACAGLLIAIGTLMVYSSSITASPSQEEQYFLSRQLLFVLIAGLAGIASSHLSADFWRHAAPWLFGATLLLLVLVLIPGVGHSVNGARRWLRLGSFSFQPSETAKLTLPLMLCALRGGRGSLSLHETRPRLREIGLVLLPMLLIVAEPDLGTALFVGTTGAAIFWLSGAPLRFFASVGALFAPAALLLLALKPYQIARVRGFILTWTHPEDAPYQIQQSLTTLGVGGLSGVGLGRGWQKLSFLPEANTDFVFAVIGEELGLVGTLAVVVLWGALYATGSRLIQRLPSFSFERILATTLLLQLALQAVTNMAVVLALVPPKGISHPFISYGGSNLLVNVVAISMIVALTRLPTPRPISDNIQASLGSSPLSESSVQHAFD
jgi:cell division protein FtsW